MHAIQSVDANLILALDALLREGSVTRAARRTNVTPPAMSHTLARLRAALGDQLFVRSGNRLVPTPRALAIHDRVLRVAGEIGALLRADSPIDLARLARTFVIRASDALVATLGSRLDAIARKEAPRVALHFVGASSDAREVDLDIGALHDLPAGMRVQTLYRDALVPVVRKHHPWAKRRLTRERLHELDWIAIAARPTKLDSIRKENRRARRRSPSRVVPSFLAAAILVRESDAFTMLPTRLLALVLRAFDLCRLEVARAAEEITIAQTWSPRFDDDAGHVWLRDAARRASDIATRA